MKESCSVSKAAGILGVSVPTVKAMCDRGELDWWLTPGGHRRICIESIRARKEGRGKQPSTSSSPSSGVLQNKLKRAKELNLEAEEVRAKREIEKLHEEDAEAGRRCEATARAARVAEQQALQDARLQAARDAERREEERGEAQQHRAEFRRRWSRWAASVLPDWLSAEQAGSVAEAVDAALSVCDPNDPEQEVRHHLELVVNRLTRPWCLAKEAHAQREQLIQHALLSLPWIATDSDKARAGAAVRAALADVPVGASGAELQAVVAAALAPIKTGIEKRAEQERARAAAERAQQERQRNKESLLSMASLHVDGYLRELHSNDAISDEAFDDCEWQKDLKVTVRKALEEELTGEESYDDLREMVRNIVDEELNGELDDEEG